MDERPNRKRTTRFQKYISSNILSHFFFILSFEDSAGGDGTVGPRHGPGGLAESGWQDGVEEGQEEEEDGRGGASGAARLGRAADHVPPPGAAPGAVRPGDARQRGLHPSGVGPHGGRGGVVVARGRRGRRHLLQHFVR